MLRIGVAFQLNGSLAYGGNFNHRGIEMISNQRARELWPREAKSFLEQRIKFVMPQVGWPQPKIGDVRPETAIGKPARVIGCTDVKNGIAYVCEWQNGAQKIMSSTAVSPDLVQTFLERATSMVNAKDVNQEHFRCNDTISNFVVFFSSKNTNH